jgi:hypothetical protein
MRASVDEKISEQRSRLFHQPVRGYLSAQPAREAIAVLAIAVFGLVCLYPALSAQFVLVDDHEIISYTQPGAGPPLDGLGIMVLSSDPAVGRFRPMYWLTRLTEITLLRDNPAAWHALVLGVGMASAALLYATARTLDLGRGLSALLGAWLLVAPGVSSVWVRLGPNETFGMLFLGIAALSGVRAARARGPGGFAWDAAFVLGCTATFLSKESLILSAPAFAGLRLVANGTQARVRAVSSAVIVLAVGGALGAAAAAIGRAAGTQSYGGDFLAPPDVRADLVRFAHNLAIIVFAGSGWLVLLLAPRLRGWLANRLELRCAAVLIVLAGVLIVPQLALYSNVGILEGRYELPAALGIIGLVLAGLHTLQLQGARTLYRLGVAVLTSTIVLFGFSSWTYAGYFAADSHELQQMLETVAREAPSADVIAITGDPARQYEPILSMTTYLYRLGRDQDHVKLLPLEPVTPPYTTGEVNLVQAIDATSLMAPPGLDQLSCSQVGALIILREDPRIRQQLPCLDSGFRPENFGARVLTWGGDVVSLRPRLPGFADISYLALLRAANQ